ncbi:tyrosine-type recombinase/integrase [Roseomonas gilardii]|nr:site-specific integrase [Roseomonas gilardii]
MGLGTARVAANNLRLWWGYLAYRGLAWDEAGSVDIDGFRNGLVRAISPRTGQPYVEGTVSHRLSHLHGFYSWANREGFTRISQSYLEDDDNRSGGRQASRRIHAFTYDEWNKLRPMAGSLPTDPKYDPTQHQCRDRLIWEVMLHTALRRSEVCALTVHQLQALMSQIDEKTNEWSAKAIRITMVKGGPKRARDAVFPTWLIRDLRAYLNGDERKNAVLAYRRSHSGKEPENLFLNHAHSKRAPGAPIQPSRLNAIFNDLMRKAGMTEVIAAIDLATGGAMERTIPLHHVHDLRHTAAVWRYQVERKRGNADPWKPVQVLLGHSDARTTQRVYLQITNLFEALVSDAALTFFRQVARGDAESVA